jgi:16S rRNA (guanine966-N2)-methyltransferase
MIALCRCAQGYALASFSGKDRSPRGARKRASAAAQNKRLGARNSVRIIGGEWRGRRIQFPSIEGLRPTPDRVRETLFNWLQGRTAAVRALDLFAGSGALGLEALSRGAREVVFVEHDGRVTAALRSSLAALGSQRGRVIERDALDYLRQAPEPFDIVFLDPPYAQGRLGELCTLLESLGWLAHDASIYLELAARTERPALPAGWTVRREMRAGEVQGLLAQRRAHRAGGEQAADAT